MFQQFRTFLRSLVIPPAPRIICAWCPEFRPAVDTAGLSHGMCAQCRARLDREMDALAAGEREREDRWRQDQEQLGATCGLGCGYCGMCS